MPLLIRLFNLTGGSSARTGEELSWWRRFVRWWVRWWNYYVAGLRMTSALMPIMTLLGCIRGWGDHRALLVGILAGLGGWAIMAWVARHFVTVDGANPDVYHELRCRFAILCTQMDTLQHASPNPAQPPSEDPQLSIRRATAMAEIDTYLREVGAELDPERVTTRHTDSRQNWVLGYGYIILQKQIHRVEENFLLIAPRPAVLAEARYDRLRLQDSTCKTPRFLTINCSFA